MNTFLFGLTVGILVCLFFSAWASNSIDKQRVKEGLLCHKGRVFKLMEINKSNA